MKGEYARQIRAGIIWGNRRNYCIENGMEFMAYAAADAANQLPPLARDAYDRTTGDEQRLLAATAQRIREKWAVATEG